MRDDENTPQARAPMTMGDAAALSFSRLGFIGRIGFAPGTAGSAVAALMAPAVLGPLPLWGRGVVLVGLFFMGALAAGRAEKVLGESDPSSVIIDEVLGQWLCLAIFPGYDWVLLGAAFVFFRLFDIFKPWPVKASEKWLPGGYGVMLDDVVAGLYALAALLLLVFLWSPGTGL